MRRKTAVILIMAVLLATMVFAQKDYQKRLTKVVEGFSIDIVVFNNSSMTDAPNGATSKEDSLVKGARYETWVIDYKSGEGYAETQHWYAYYEPTFTSSPSITYTYFPVPAGNVHITDVENFKRWNSSSSTWERITWNKASEVNPDTLVFKMFDVEGAFAGSRGILKEVYEGACYDTLILGDSVAIHEHHRLPTDAFYLSQNTPNPFKTQTTIQYMLPRKADVYMTVTNIMGEKVATLIDGSKAPGNSTVTWDGKFDDGTKAPNGVYFYNFRAGDYQKKMKMILTR